MSSTQHSILSAGPSPAAAESVTCLLHEMRQEKGPGRSDAWDRIYSVVYGDIYQIARSQLRRRRYLAMSPTSLVSEGWLTLAKAAASATDRTHLVALMARAMRYAVSDEAKYVLASKRGHNRPHIELTSEVADDNDDVSQCEHLLLLAQLLEFLEEINPRMATIVELRYFGELNHEEIGALLDINPSKVRREWESARELLAYRMKDIR